MVQNYQPQPLLHQKLDLFIQIFARPKRFQGASRIDSLQLKVSHLGETWPQNNTETTGTI